MAFLAILVAASLLLIAGLHLFWAFGGKWGAAAALPKKADGSLLFQPGRLGCVVVAIGLSAMAWLALAQLKIIPQPVNASWSVKLLWSSAIIFGLRCLGDFRYVGAFRKIRATDFAVMDRKFYTPLCAFYSVAFFTIALRR